MIETCSQSSILVCPLVSVSVSSQLPLLLQCLLPPHVQSGECSMSKHPNLHEGSSQQPLPGHLPQPLQATAFVCRACVCVLFRTCFKETCKASFKSESRSINRVKNAGLVWRSDQLFTVNCFPFWGF